MMTMFTTSEATAQARKALTVPKSRVVTDGGAVVVVEMVTAMSLGADDSGFVPVG
jgi:hypothetical protein